MNQECCTDCMCGQGDDCHCRDEQDRADQRAMASLALGLVAFWVLVALLAHAVYAQ